MQFSPLPATRDQIFSCHSGLPSFTSFISNTAKAVTILPCTTAQSNTAWPHCPLFCLYSYVHVFVACRLLFSRLHTISNTKLLRETIKDAIPKPYRKGVVPLCRWRNHPLPWLQFNMAAHFPLTSTSQCPVTEFERQTFIRELLQPFLFHRRSSKAIKKFALARPDGSIHSFQHRSIHIFMHFLAIPYH